MRRLISLTSLWMVVTLLFVAGGIAQQTTAPPRVRYRGYVINLRRESIGSPLVRGGWVAFYQEEFEKDLNRDGDIDDTLLCVARVQRPRVIDTGLVVDEDSADDPEDWAVDISADGRYAAVLVYESDAGDTDLNGDGESEDEILHLYDLNTRKATNLRIEASRPTFWRNKILFTSDEAVEKKDFNGDGDMRDEVLLIYDLDTRQITNTKIEAVQGFRVSGNWAACETSEADQGRTDLNGDGDVFDLVILLYNLETGEIVNTKLDSYLEWAVTPYMVASVIQERREGLKGKDFNGDGDLNGAFVRVFNIETRTSTDIKRDGGAGMSAAGKLLAFVARERVEKADLNGDGDQRDAVAYVYNLDTGKTINLGRDASQGIVVLKHNKIAFATSESSQGVKDLNGDKDTRDIVLLVYDAGRNRVFNTKYTVDSELFAYPGGNLLGFLALESDQGNRDMNGDRDTDDDIACVYNAAGNSIYMSRQAAVDVMSAGKSAVAIITAEDEQGGADLNNDGERDDEIIQLLRLVRRK